MFLLELNIQMAITIGASFMAFICIAWLLAEFKGMKDSINERLGINNETIKLRLQAYERLTLYAERVGLKSLISRVTYTEQSAAGLHQDLLKMIKDEYEYNVSQQIYVSKEVWAAIIKLKDQNTYIINQIAATLPSDVRAVELSKRILEYTLNDKAEINVIVIDALQYESKQHF